MEDRGVQELVEDAGGDERVTKLVTQIESMFTGRQARYDVIIFRSERDLRLGSVILGHDADKLLEQITEEDFKEAQEHEPGSYVQFGNQIAYVYDPDRPMPSRTR